MAQMWATSQKYKKLTKPQSSNSRPKDYYPNKIQIPTHKKMERKRQNKKK